MKQQLLQQFQQQLQTRKQFFRSPPRNTAIALFGILVLCRLSAERNAATPYIRRTSLIEPDSLLLQNDYTSLLTDQHDAIDFNDEDNTRPLPFFIGDSKFNYTVNGTNEMGDFANHFFQGNMCKNMFNVTKSAAMVSETTVQPKTFVSIRFNCQDLFAKSIYGTGNFISAVYALRMAANTIGNIHLEYICDDAETEQANLILPWLTGWFPAVVERATVPTIQQACSSYKTVPIGNMYKQMTWELRRMAIALVGIPNESVRQWADEHYLEHGRSHSMQLAVDRDTPPIFNKVELDDTVLHFRCGDLISSTHPSFGFMKFGSYTRHLDGSKIRSIGIVTQPFDNDAQTRKYDGGQSNKDKCKRVVYAFVDHLKEMFPKANIAIRNDAKETIALTFARMIMAEQLVIGISSFGVFPGVATFGKSFIRKPDYHRAPNRWLLDNPSIEKVAPHVTLIEEPRLMAATCKYKWRATNGTAVMDWFQNYASTME